MERQTNTDDWSSLLTELGVGTSPQEFAAEPAAEPVVTASEPPIAETPIETTSVSEFPSPPVEEPKRSGEGKRTFLDRFPKINLFGTSPKDPLDAAVGGTKPLTKPAEAFTSKRLEKVDPPRTARKESAPGVSPAPVLASASKGQDPWSLIASQVGSLTAPEAVEEPIVETAPDAVPSVVLPTAAEPLKQDSSEESPWEKWKIEPPRRGRSAPPSMFDDEPVEESKESTAVRNILDTNEPKPFADAAERLCSIFDEPPSRNDKEPEQREHHRHVRGQRSNEFRQEPAKERGPAKTDADEPYAAQRKLDDRKREERPSDRRNANEPRPERGQRGSRYGKKEYFETEPRERGFRQSGPVERDRPVSITANEDDFKTESMWDVEEESKPVERSGRRRSRHSQRTERSEQGSGRSPSARHREERDVVIPRDPEDSTFTSSGDFDQLHRNIPSWDDAVSSIIEANTARRTKRGSDQRRGRGVRREA